MLNPRHVYMVLLRSLSYSRGAHCAPDLMSFVELTPAITLRNER